MITLYLGDAGSYLEKIAKSVDPGASLLTINNFNSLTAGTYYTSIKELTSAKILATVLRNVDKVIYSPPDYWSDEHGRSQLQQLTEEHLKIFRWVKPVENFASITEPTDQKNILALLDSRKTNDPQLWIAGCSVTSGAGVELDQRYGQLIADELNLKVSFITTRSSSVQWAADQILRSDIRNGDTVVWGMAPMTRIPFFNNNELFHVSPMNYISNPKLKHLLDIGVLDNDNQRYQLVTGIFQVINFCSKVKAKLVIAMLGDVELLDYLKDVPNLIILCGLWGFDISKGRRINYSYMDIGSDNYHPGANTHQYYAQEILRKIKQL